jgi:predicted AAA+ superfamily ATPase
MKTPSKLMERTSYLDKIEPFMRNNLIKVLSGQRRVGKSYLIFQIINTITTR